MIDVQRGYTGVVLTVLLTLGCSGETARSPEVAAEPDPLPARDAESPDSGEPKGSGAMGSEPADGALADADSARHDAGSLYDPCPPKGSPCVIMPLGDSITYGAFSSAGGGYRVFLFEKALGAHQSITFVGRRQNGPASVSGAPFPRGSEGYSGYSIEKIALLTQAAVQTDKPHIVTLMAGTNDLNGALATAPARLGDLIDLIAATDPKILVVVAQITPTQDAALDAKVVTYNAAIPAVVAARIKQGKHVTLVDMYSAFTANPNYKTDLLGNNKHPNDKGYAVMADVWYAAIGPLLH